MPIEYNKNQENMKEEKGLRYNQGKNRLDLLPTFAINDMAKVITIGSEKYAVNNWRKGMKWSNVIASLKRHLLALESGEDFDSESGLLHASHLLCNAAFLNEYYYIAPEYDDRFRLEPKRIALDIDEVICDFITAYADKYDVTYDPQCWYYDSHIIERLNTLTEDKEFWLSLKTKIDPKDLLFEPVAYISSRSFMLADVTRQWLSANGFPNASNVVCCGSTTEDKSFWMDELNIDILIDDSPLNFTDLSSKGYCCYLLDKPYNRTINAGFKRIYHINDVVSKDIRQKML